MLNYGLWLADVSPIDESERAERVWRLIQRRPSSVVLVRGNTALAAQTVRLEYSNTINEASGGAGSSAVQRCVVFGVKNHPTADDTDIQRGDVFARDGVRYRVVGLVDAPGEVQALCEAMQ